MPRELRVSTSDLNYSDPAEDCYIDPCDPAFALTQPGRVVAQQAQQHFEQRNQAGTQGIRPGTPAWFAMTQHR